MKKKTTKKSGKRAVKDLTAKKAGSVKGGENPTTIGSATGGAGAGKVKFN